MKRRRRSPVTEPSVPAPPVVVGPPGAAGHLTAEFVDQLREAGVSDDVVAALSRDVPEGGQMTLSKDFPTLRKEFPTMNAEKLMGIDRILADHVTGVSVLPQNRLDEWIEERRKLLAHFEQIRHCPTCGHPLADRAAVSRVPADR